MPFKNKPRPRYDVTSPRPVMKPENPEGLSKLLGERLKALRKAKGLTQQQAARAMQITDATLCRCERGKHLPTYATLQIFVEFYGVTYDHLLRGEQ